MKEKECTSKIRENENDQEQVQFNSSPCPEQQTGQEHQQLRDTEIYSTSEKPRGQFFPDRRPVSYSEKIDEISRT